VSGVSLVIPAWNEPDAIGAVLDEVPVGAVNEVFVVVASSSDPTAEVARSRRAHVLVQGARGYGAACWTGAVAALEHDAHVVAFLDGDYSDPPAALPRVLAPIQRRQADLVLGCRDLRLFPDALPRYAVWGNKLICEGLNILLRTDFRDLPSFKAITADGLRQLAMREMTYGWTVEMLAKASRRGLRVEQVAVEYRPRRGGTSKVSGDPRASVAAACKLLTCAARYSSLGFSFSLKRRNFSGVQDSAPESQRISGLMPGSPEPVVREP
jgi:glycosyltransferase involved in cell wall biosynthesis